jgi:hypothetical protein
MLRKQPKIQHINAHGDLVDFSEDKVRITLHDCLDALAKERRYHNRIPWTVLLHSIVVGRVAEELYTGNIPLIQKAYCHDLQESVVRDVPTPIKRAVGNNWDNLELDIQTKIFNAIGLKSKIGTQDESLLHEIDKAVGFVEAEHFFPQESGIVELLTEEAKTLNPVVIAKAAQMFVSVMSMAETYCSEDGEVTDFTYSLYRTAISLGVE